MSHQSFPIADFDLGLFEGREPWLSPQNAFETLKNGRVYLGRLEKRRGYSRFSEMGIQASQVSGTIPGAGARQYVPSPTSRTVVPESMYFEFNHTTDGLLKAEVNHGTESYNSSTGLWEWPVYEYGTTDEIGTAWRETSGGVSSATVVWSSHSGWTTSDGVTVGTMDYWYNPENAVVGLANFRDSNGEYLIAVDTDSVYKYDTTNGFFKEESTASVFSGDADDYFWIWPLDSYVVMTNGVDAVHKWTPGAGTPVAEMSTDFDSGAAGNDIDTCALVVRLAGRLVYLNTTENGTKYPFRARWTTAGSFETFDDSLDYADAPSNLGEIVTAGLIGERMFVGFEKGWMELVDTGDSASPLEWRPLTSRYGAASKLSTIPDSERLLSRSRTQMQAVDPNGQYSIDGAIPDKVLGFNANKTDLSVGIRNEEKRAFWWTYVSTVDTQPKNVLVAQYNAKNELAWSTYDMPFQVFAAYQSETKPTWDTFSGSWDDYPGIGWDSAGLTEGFPQLLGGARDGQVYVFDSSDSDYGSDITFEAETMELAPFPTQKSQLGWLDLYGTAVSGVTLTLRFYANTTAAAYKTQTFDLTPDATSGKVYRRIRVNKIAAFHRIKITSTGSSFFAIDSIVPWFRPAGRIREFG